ncbi:hypothetical protein TNCV_185111 [Trichonephila clavipes]|nr:hypothetical protein TNCV_185111 [Trichonephila clavipes]
MFDLARFHPNLEGECPWRGPEASHLSFPSNNLTIGFVARWLIRVPPCQGCEFQMLNDDVIVTSMQEEFDPVGDETGQDEDNNNDESIKGSSNTDVFSALETAKE